MKVKTLGKEIGIGVFSSSSPISAIVPIRYERGVHYLKAHSKVVIGYSDVTTLLLAIYAKTGLNTFYGTVVASSFGECGYDI